MPTETPTVFTIGHSTRSLAEFVELLLQNQIRTLVDVRRHPGSRRYPHFSGSSLQETVALHSGQYVHLGELGGRRKARPDSENQFWKNESFRGYADHMATEQFGAAIDRLLLADGPVAIMCAEAVPWRCHRMMISDELSRRGCEVLHIISGESPSTHRINPAARDRGSHLAYPGQQSLLLV